MHEAVFNRIVIEEANVLVHVAAAVKPAEPVMCVAVLRRRWCQKTSWSISFLCVVLYTFHHRWNPHCVVVSENLQNFFLERDVKGTIDYSHKCRHHFFSLRFIKQLNSLLHFVSFLFQEMQLPLVLKLLARSHKRSSEVNVIPQFEHVLLFRLSEIVKNPFRNFAEQRERVTEHLQQEIKCTVIACITCIQWDSFQAIERASFFIFQSFLVGALYGYALCT
jgi:hypothetical protein